MGGVDQRHEVLGTSVGAVRRIWKDAIVAPIVATGKITDRHDLDSRDSEPGQMVKLVHGRAKSPFWRERADMQLVDDRLLPRAPDPVVGFPMVMREIDNFAWAMHVFRLMARTWVRHLKAVRKHETVKAARTGRARPASMPAFLVAIHG